MARRVVITGLGAVSGLGIGMDVLWEGACAGRSAIAPIEAFETEGFDSRIGSEVRDFSVKKFVPKTYRKATKVMARDIELAVAAAELAVRDAKMVTPGVEPDGERTYEGPRVGAHIGAGLIAADIDELTEAFAEATDAEGNFDMHRWGEEGMTHLTPLWLLKYLPNMLACHVTIIHDAQGPSNTITCGEASSGLSIGESMRVIERGNADACFCGGAESKMNPM
ncbi:MAG: beta-ketoacyl synthase N-terminal-like domain-containing protein, partial [Phycisphaeraceae bacterium]